MSAGDQVAALRDAFATAMDRRAEDVREGVHAFAGANLRTRIVGRGLAEVIERPLLPERPGLPVRYSLDLWEGQGPPMGADIELEERGGPAGEIIGFTHDGTYVRHSGPDFVLWLDVDSAHVTGWIRSADSLSPWHRYRPWQVLLGPWMIAAGHRVVHAAVVSRGDDALLLPGRNHAGKSTTALAALDAGFDVLADDVAAIDTRAGVAHGLYAVIKARQPPADPAARVVQVADPLGNPEYVTFLGEAAPERRRASARIRAIALPRLHDVDGSSWRVASPSAALRTLLATDQAPRPGHVDAAFAAWSELAESVPLFRLDIGRDASAIARALDELLAEAVA